MGQLFREQTEKFSESFSNKLKSKGHLQIVRILKYIQSQRYIHVSIFIVATFS